MSRITLTILGTTAGVPTKERAHAAIHLSHDDGVEFSSLFDCGEGTQRQMIMAGLNFRKMNNIFITHWHGDHCLGLGGLIDTMGFEERTRPLDVYGPEAKRQMRRYLGFVHPMGEFPVIAHDVRAKGPQISEVMRTDKFRIVSSPVKHSVPVVSYALLENDKVSFDEEKAALLGLPKEGALYGELKRKGKIKLGGRVISLEDVTVRGKGKKVVFSGDTEICDNLKAMAHGADLLVQDCTYFEPDGAKKYMHAYFSEIKEMAENENVKRVILTHISRKYQDAGQLRKMIGDSGRFELAEDFMKVTI